MPCYEYKGPTYAPPDALDQSPFIAGERRERLRKAKQRSRGFRTSSCFQKWLPVRHGLLTSFDPQVPGNDKYAALQHGSYI